MQWGKYKDNYISLSKKGKPFKVIIDTSRFFLCFYRLRICIQNPLYDIDDCGWLWSKWLD